MSIFKIAWRSIQHRGLGSLLTILSMALGVMLVVSVLTIYGVVSQSFKANSSFGYDVLVGARGGSIQLTMNSVFYLSKPIENIPYEYYLDFCDQPTRERELQHSLAAATVALQNQLHDLANANAGFIELPVALADQQVTAIRRQNVERQMGIRRSGKLSNYVEMAIPINLGDYLGHFRVVGTKPGFFTELVLDIDTEEKFTFAEGRAFEEFSQEHGYFECVLGKTVAQDLINPQTGKRYQIGDLCFPIHGDPNSAGAHIHEQGFTIVGILDRTGTPHDRAVFVNMEGFFLMEDHAKEVDEKTMIGQRARPATPQRTRVGWTPPPQQSENEIRETTDLNLLRSPLPIEQREVTAILVRTYRGGEDDDEFMELGWGAEVMNAVEEGFLESSLDWSPYRPARAQTSCQAVSPVLEVTGLFESFLSPVRWVLLLLTFMICVVSGISILVGIYNSMSQRRHEIAVMRALGAGRHKVMAIMFAESVMLALAGGIFGWVAGHALNAVVSPFVESNTGVSIGFTDFAPGIPVFAYLFPQGIPFLKEGFLQSLLVSPEFLLIPGLILLAIVVGIYPAISAYRTDVSESLGV